MPGPPAPHPALSRHLGFLVSRVATIAREAFFPELERIGLDIRMWAILNVLDHEDGITQGSLGRMSAIDPSSMVAAIDELEGHGYVERRRNPNDRRAYSLHLTTPGREILRQARKRARAAHERWLEPLNGDERDQLRDLLLRIAQAADADEPAVP